MIYRLKFVAPGSLDPFVGRAMAWRICIDARYHSDDGLLAHELTHVRQFWRTLGLHMLLYPLSRRYRLRCEVEAYRRQLQYAVEHGTRPQLAELFAAFIVDRYNLRLTDADIPRIKKELLS